MYLKDLIAKARSTLSYRYPEGEAREMVFRLLEHYAGTMRHTHILEPSYEVSDEKVAAVEEACTRLADGEPLQYVIGTASFYGRSFRVSPSVLIPRPETELLCRMAADTLKQTSGPVSVLDMCTGSGCIAWTMALECPGAEVHAVDISEDALEVARNQDFRQEMHDTGAKAPVFLQADVLGDPSESPFFSSVGGNKSFDLILSNPPYVMDREKALMRANVLEHEPHLALFVPDDDPLIFYRAVAAWACRLLAPKGTGIVEINEALGPQTVRVFLDSGFSYAEVAKDFSDRDRFVIFRR